jgi:hypothetical protein
MTGSARKTRHDLVLFLGVVILGHWIASLCSYCRFIDTRFEEFEVSWRARDVTHEVGKCAANWRSMHLHQGRKNRGTLRYIPSHPIPSHPSIQTIQLHQPKYNRPLRAPIVMSRQEPITGQAYSHGRHHAPNESKSQSRFNLNIFSRTHLPQPPT